MNKREFLNELSRQLDGYDYKNDCLDYFDEIISDRISRGKNEEQVISELGDISVIVTKVLGGRPEKKFSYTERSEKAPSQRKICVWKVVLAVLLAPTILGTAFGILAGVLGIVVGLVAGGASGAVGCIVVAIMNIIHYSGALALAQIGVALMGIGVCSLMAFGGLCFGIFVCKGLEKIFGSFKGIGEWFYEE